VVDMGGFNGALEENETFGNRCAVVRNEDGADADQGLAWKIIECSVFHDYVRGETVI
jgi:hypothetical protein